MGASRKLRVVQTNRCVTEVPTTLQNHLQSTNRDIITIRLDALEGRGGFNLRPVAFIHEVKFDEAGGT